MTVAGVTSQPDPGVQADGDDDVVHQRDERGDRHLPLERHGEVEDDRQQEDPQADAGPARETSPPQVAPSHLDAHLALEPLRARPCCMAGDLGGGQVLVSVHQPGGRAALHDHLGGPRRP